MKALIIGAAGFVGGHLTRHLRALGWEVAATKLAHESLPPDPALRVLDLDVRDEPRARDVLREIAPEAVFHLAAQSSVKLSWEQPGFTAQINILGGLNVLEAARSLPRAPRVLLIGSGEEYGAVRPDQVPICEDTPLRPGNVYAVTKAAQGMLGQLYSQAYALPVICVRAFNHVGPGQAPSFVVADFCRQVAQIECGRQEPVLRVGNLSARRDFTDVQDVVRAYALLAERGQPGQTYNVGSGRSVSVGSVLELLLGMARVPIAVVTDPDRFRPVDVPDIHADIAKIRADTGWAPAIPLEQTLRETLDDFRRQAKHP